MILVTLIFQITIKDVLQVDPNKKFRKHESVSCAKGKKTQIGVLMQMLLYGDVTCQTTPTSFVEFKANVKCFTGTKTESDPGSIACSSTGSLDIGGCKFVSTVIVFPDSHGVATEYHLCLSHRHSSDVTSPPQSAVFYRTSVYRLLVYKGKMK